MVKKCILKIKTPTSRLEASVIAICDLFAPGSEMPQLDHSLSFLLWLNKLVINIMKVLDSEVDWREHQVSSPRLCSVCGIAVDGGADGDVGRFTGGLAGHAGVWTSGEAAGREGCRKERAPSVQISPVSLQCSV